MNLEDARAAVRFAHIQSRDTHDRPTKILVPGHEGRRYEEILRWADNGLTVECRQDLGLGFKPCPSQANGDKRVCYHAIAAVMKAFADKGYEVSWADTDAAIRRLKRLHPGNMLYLMPFKGGEQVWFLAFLKGQRRE